MAKKKIYVSGKITGLPIEHVKKKFGMTCAFLRTMGFEPINPLEISPFAENKTWEDYMLDDIKKLFKCDAIYMLDNWRTSKGARVEYAIARELGLEIYFYGDNLK